jgi:preprotein translocase subunit SecD
MNHYPLWKYLLIFGAILIGMVYTLPNFYGESPAVQVMPARPTLKADGALLKRVEEALKTAKIETELMALDAGSIKVRFSDIDTQGKAKDILQAQLGEDYAVSLNLHPRSPQWLSKLNALPMYLGLDLRGGVHFMLQVDMKSVLDKAVETAISDFRLTLREKNIPYSGVSREGNSLNIRFRDEATRSKGMSELQLSFRGMEFNDSDKSSDFRLTAVFKLQEIQVLQKAALQQNLTTLRNRVNELGVAEPVIQQQGADRIVVQLPGMQDTTQAERVLGRTATLQIRMVEAHLSPESRDFSPEKIEAARKGVIPSGTELLYSNREGREPEPLLISKQIVFTGENLTGADASIDQQNSGSVVSVKLDAKGGIAMKNASRDGIKRRMAVILIDKGRPEVLTAPTIQSELSNRFQITGMRNTEEANELALLMRAGALAAPMEIIEKRTVGPSLGAENIARGFHSTQIGFVAIAVFMVVYYLMFGGFSIVALGANLLLLVALLSMLQATLTLPGMAAIALTLGMAIDSNVLINERIREELRNGVPPQTAIHVGYQNAFATILDSNITTLIAGIALFIFGTGPIRGFAVVLCLGIMTSMFSSVMVSRALVNLVYGRKTRLNKVSIG